MKKVIFILLFIPMIGYGQDFQITCYNDEEMFVGARIKISTTSYSPGWEGHIRLIANGKFITYPTSATDKWWVKEDNIIIRHSNYITYTIPIKKLGWTTPWDGTYNYSRPNPNDPNVMFSEAALQRDKDFRDIDSFTELGYTPKDIVSLMGHGEGRSYEEIRRVMADKHDIEQSKGRPGLNIPESWLIENEKYKGKFVGSGLITVIECNIPSVHLKLSTCIKKYVEEKINIWQEKGEFEKLTVYHTRVNENSRNAKIDLYQNQAIQYYKEIVIESFYRELDKQPNKFITLNKYDSENETFLFSISNLDSFVLGVPIHEAQAFKNSFNSNFFQNIDFVIKDDRFVVSHIEYAEFDDTSYTYDIYDNYRYVTTTIDYNFNDIDIKIEESTYSDINTKERNTIKIGKSIVDSDIPIRAKINNRFALVIGNEDYTSFQRTLNIEQDVDYAENDASVFKEYCLNTLGVKEENMHFLLNATAGQMSQEIDLISKILSKVGNEAELIVYYAGHGYPDELTKVPYLIPVDVSASNLSSAIKLDDLYQKLANTNADKITIFLDACFTGGGRNSGLVASRGIKVKPKQGSLNGNIVVFSASSGNQSSLPNHKEAHGMFTYHLLKKLQSTKGDVTLGDLANYLNENVSIQSLRVNKKEQDPTVNTSQKVINDWRNWTF